MKRLALWSAVTVVAAAVAANAAEPKWSGYLCCNMRSDGKWISDINYEDGGKHIIPAGTPAEVIGYGRYRVKVKLNNKEQAIGNDYSRDLSDETFGRRYVVADDVAARIASYSSKVQAAIMQARVAKGMTKEQVMMSVGYPVSSENPHLEAPVWRFWLSSFAEYHVRFDDAGQVADVEADRETRDKVLME